jgi:hypothetical protein
MPAMPATRLAPLALALAAVAGCARGGGDAVTPTPVEQHLVDIIRTDGFVEVTQLERDAKGFLLVTTRQGQTRVRYLLASPAGQPLAIHRIEDRVRLDVGDDGTCGTGPDPRGLRDHLGQGPR